MQSNTEAPPDFISYLSPLPSHNPKASLAPLIFLENACMHQAQGLCTYCFLYLEHSSPDIRMACSSQHLGFYSNVNFSRDLSQSLPLDNTIRPHPSHHFHSFEFYPSLFYFPAVTTPDMLYTHLYFVGSMRAMVFLILFIVVSSVTTFVLGSH